MTGRGNVECTGETKATEELCVEDGVQRPLEVIQELEGKIKEKCDPEARC